MSVRVLTFVTPTSLKSLRSRLRSSVPEISCSLKAWQYVGSPTDSSHCDTSSGPHLVTTCNDRK